MFFCGYIRTARYEHVTESPIKIIQIRAKGAMDWLVIKPFIVQCRAGRRFWNETGYTGEPIA